MSRLVISLFLLFLTSSAVCAQTENVLLIRHFNSKHQYYFSPGNTITVHVVQGEKIKGIIASISESSLVVNGTTILLQDIVKIKRPSGNNTYAQVFGGIFVFEGILIMLASQGEPEFILGGVTAIGIGLPLLLKPAFKVRKNCQLEVAQKYR